MTSFRLDRFLDLDKDPFIPPFDLFLEQTVPPLLPCHYTFCPALWSSLFGSQPLNP
jgi:hypothetical protein